MKRIAQLEKAHALLEQRFAALQATHDRMLRRLAFPGSEKTVVHHPDQQQLPFMQDLVPDPPSPPPLEEASKSTTTLKPAPKRRGRGLRTLPDHLEPVVQYIELAEALRRDADGSLLVPVGEERTEKLDFVPGRFRKLILIRIRYGRRDTREPVRTAPVPACIVQRGLPTDDLVLHIAHAKYAQSLPLYRQRQEWLRHGVDLSVPTMCSWMEHLSSRLEPVVGAIRQQVLAQPFLHLDDTL